MNVLERHSRHQLTILVCWPKSLALKLQFALSFLRIFEATCSLIELNRINLTFQGTEKAVLLPTIQDPRLPNCEGSKNSWNRCHWENTIQSPSAWNPDDPDIRFDAQLQITVNISSVSCQDVHYSKSVEKRFVFAEKVRKQPLDLKHMAALSGKVM